MTSTMYSLQEKEKETNDCSICYDLMEDVNISTTRCGHKFHTSCLIRAALIKSLCPYCRGPLLESVPIHEVPQVHEPAIGAVHFEFVARERADAIVDENGNIDLDIYNRDDFEMENSQDLENSQDWWDYFAELISSRTDVQPRSVLALPNHRSRSQSRRSSR